MSDSKTKFVHSFGKGRKGRRLVRATVYNTPHVECILQIIRRLQLMFARTSTNATKDVIAPAAHVDAVVDIESTDTVTVRPNTVTAVTVAVTDAGETRHSPVSVSQVLFTFFLVTVP